MTVRGITRQIRKIEKAIRALQRQIDELEQERLGWQYKLEALLRQDETPF
jgi:hypothetical protein